MRALEDASSWNDVQRSQQEIPEGEEGRHRSFVYAFGYITMFDNREFDARDDKRTANRWVGNRCRTDFPTGTICGGF